VPRADVGTKHTGDIDMTRINRKLLLLMIAVFAAGIFAGWILRGAPIPDQTGTLGDPSLTSPFLDQPTETRVESSKLRENPRPYIPSLEALPRSASSQVFQPTGIEEIRVERGTLEEAGRRLLRMQREVQGVLSMEELSLSEKKREELRFSVEKSQEFLRNNLAFQPSLSPPYKVRWYEAASPQEGYLYLEGHSGPVKLLGVDGADSGDLPQGGDSIFFPRGERADERETWSVDELNIIKSSED